MCVDSIHQSCLEGTTLLCSNTGYPRWMQIVSNSRHGQRAFTWREISMAEARSNSGPSTNWSPKLCQLEVRNIFLNVDKDFSSLKNHLIPEPTLLRWRSKRYHIAAVLEVKANVYGYALPVSMGLESSLRGTSILPMKDSEPSAMLIIRTLKPHARRSLSD